MRLAGDPAASPHLVKAKERIHELGGLEATNSYVRFYLAMAGAIDWSMVPAIPPELMLLPNWFPVNIYEMSSWTRGIVIPLVIIYASKPEWRLPEGVDFRLSFSGRPGARPVAFAWDKSVVTWRNCFLAIGPGPEALRAIAVEAVSQAGAFARAKWMLERLERSEGLGTIYPAMMNSIFALLALGGDTDRSAGRPRNPFSGAVRDRRKGRHDSRAALHLPGLGHGHCDGVARRSRASIRRIHRLSPRSAGCSKNQILGPGDWQVKNQKAEPGGWVFEFRNDFYPDVDDTAFVLMALGRVADPEPTRLRNAIQRGLGLAGEHAE